MTKFLRKVFLYGILLSSVNYELAYSQVTGQFNIAVDLENNIGSSNNQFQDKETITYNTTIGAYNIDKYEIKDNILYEKDKVFCTLNPNADDYGIFKCRGDPYYCSYTTKITYTDGKEYYIFPICNSYYIISNFLRIANDGNISIYNINTGHYDLIALPQYTNDIATTTVDDVNIMCVKIGDIYKLSGNDIVYNEPFAKYSTKPNETTMKWYKTINAAGDLPADSKDYEPLNKAIFTITSDGELTLSEPEGGGGMLLFWKLPISVN